MTEEQLEAEVARLCGMFGWMRYHTRDSRRSTAGWPDDAVVHPHWREFLLAELKTDTGKVTAEQQAWLDALRAAGVEVHVWRPRDLEEIARRLSRPRGASRNARGWGRPAQARR